MEAVAPRASRPRPLCRRVSSRFYPLQPIRNLNMNRRRLLAPLLLPALFFFIFPLPAEAAAPPSPSPDAMPQVPAPILRVAVDAPLQRYGKDIKGGAHTNGGHFGGWQIPLAVAAWQGQTGVDRKLLEQIEVILDGEHSISANGGYPAQHELVVTGMLAILKQSDRFWQERLTDEQRQKLDLLMKAAVVGSAYTTGDATYAGGQKPTTLDGDRNLNRGWNPNFRDGMFGHLLVGSVYFGGADAVRQMLTEYDHDAFVEQLQQAGLTNTADIFTWKQNHPNSDAPSAEQIQQNVRNYRLEGRPLPEPFELYVKLTENTYNGRVNAGLNDGRGITQNGKTYGRIVDGADRLPNRGQLGMLSEFDARDAKGPRSSIVYTYHGFRPNLVNHTALVVGGYWPENNPRARQLLQRLDVGITDLAYKLEQGYLSYGKGKGSDQPFTINQSGWGPSFQTLLPFWSDVLKPYHEQAER